MRHLKLFEEFVSKFYDVVKDLPPNEGIIAVKDHDQLETLITYFEDKGFVEGVSQSHFNTRSWLKKEWRIPAGEQLYFQWVSNNEQAYKSGKNNMYVFMDNPKTINNDDKTTPYEFEDYFELKPGFRGHKLKKYGI
jgi:hypothetical protein